MCRTRVSTRHETNDTQGPPANKPTLKKTTTNTGLPSGPSLPLPINKFLAKCTRRPTWTPSSIMEKEETWIVFSLYENCLCLPLRCLKQEALTACILFYSCVQNLAKGFQALFWGQMGSKTCGILHLNLRRNLASLVRSTAAAKNASVILENTFSGKRNCLQRN